MMSTLTEDSIIERIEGLLASELDNEIVMLNVERGNYYGLTGVAKRIWEMLDASQSVRDICQSLQEEFDVEPETCLKDVLAFIDKMISENMVRIIK